MPSKAIRDLSDEIYCNLHHGECLYDEEMFDGLIKDIDRLKSFCTIEFNNNQEPEEK